MDEEGISYLLRNLNRGFQTRILGRIKASAGVHLTDQILTA